MTDILAFLGGVTAAGVATSQPVSATNPLPVTVGAGPGAALPVVGNIASGVADAGAPVKVGGVFRAAPITVATGQRVDLALNSHGAAITAPALSTGAAVSEFTAGADARPNAAAAYVSFNYPSVFNGATWDRVTKPRAAFRIPASAASNNAANIKATPGTVFGITALITASAPTGVYLKFFDVAGVPNPAATVPLYVFGLTYNTGPVGIANILLPPSGLYFPTGIGVAIVGGAADLDNTAIAVGQLLSLNVAFA